jgi:hypothetical protein
VNTGERKKTGSQSKGGGARLAPFITTFGKELTKESQENYLKTF